MAVSFSQFASNLTTEKAFDVLAIARQLQAKGKDVIALQIGDSPFRSTAWALAAGKQALEAGHTRYAPSQGLLEVRETIAKTVNAEFGIAASADNVVLAPGAKPFELFFCEAFLEPGDEVLLFSPTFPTFEPNIARRGAKAVFANLTQENQFRPDPNDVEHFLKTAKKPKAIFLNSPHNPTGGVATEDDLTAIAHLIRGKDIALLSDEPYCHMVWEGQPHRSILTRPGMMEQCVGAYTFSKSYSMSGWRLGYAIASPTVTQMMSKMINTSISCVPPFVQLAGKAALEQDTSERNEAMHKIYLKVKLLVEVLKSVEGVTVLMPAGTFYVFPKVQPICERLGITSHGLAMYLLEGADDHRGVACLGGECFGAAGQGFLRFSCAESDERLLQAVDFFQEAITRTDRVRAYLDSQPQYRLR